MRGLSVLSLVLGLASVGSLFLAISTDYWLYTSEPIDFENMILEGQGDISEDDFPPEALDGWDEGLNESTQIILPTAILLHSGLWRSCVYYEDIDYPSQCVAIGYGQTWERVEGGDTTNSILRSMRRASPFIVVSELVLVAAFACSTVGNAKRDTKTVYGAVQYVIGTLVLGVGMIIYIAAVNDEVSRRKKPPPNASDEFRFHYHYGWDVLFASIAFTSALMAAVSNISLYIRRYTHMDDITIIVPGLDVGPRLIIPSSPELSPSRFRIAGLDKRNGYDPVNLIEMDVLNNHRSLSNHIML